MIQTRGYAAKHSFSSLKLLEFEREEIKDNELEIEVQYCGVCHSDVHQVKNEWKNTLYPCLPGHEIIGRVASVGSQVTKFKIGDRVGVGCMIDSCGICPSCAEGLQQYCESEEGFLATYNSHQRKPTKEHHTYGGYANNIVVKEKFVLSIPESLDSASAALLLCAGVTTYSPMKYWQVEKGTQVGVIGLGGLGHVAVKIAIALGADVTVITSNSEKMDAAFELGADRVIFSEDKADMEKNGNSLDFILNTIPQPHDVNVYFPLLKRDGVIAIVGCIAPLKAPLDLSKILIDRKTLGTSLIGSIEETQEVLDFCALHNIAANIKVIPISEINEAFKEIDNGEVSFRYVIDMATLND